MSTANTMSHTLSMPAHIPAIIPQLTPKSPSVVGESRSRREAGNGSVAMLSTLITHRMLILLVEEFFLLRCVSSEKWLSLRKWRRRTT